MFKLENEGQFQGYTYTLSTQKACSKPGYGFISTIKIGGVKQKTTLVNRANAYEAHQEGMVCLRQLIEASPLPFVVNQK